MTALEVGWRHVATGNLFSLNWLVSEMTTSSDTEAGTATTAG